MAILKHLVGVAVAAPVLASALIAAPAHAAATASQVWVENGKMSIVATGTTVNKIRIEPTPDGFYVIDDMAPLQLDPARAARCFQASGTVVQCRTWYTVAAELGVGNDTFDNARGSNLDVLVRGGDGNDTISSGSAHDEIFGDNGVDTIYGGAGNDDLHGGNDDDKLYGESGYDTLSGEGGNDSAWGGDHADRFVNDNNTRDSFWGESGDDIMDSANHVRGGPGNDTVYMTTGFGDLYGEGDVDTLDYTFWNRGSIVLSLDGNANDGNPFPSCPILINCSNDRPNQHNVHGDFETIIGTPNDDTITGNSNRQIIRGGNGSDRLFGLGGNDVVDAGSGWGQTTDGGAGTDECYGEGVSTRRNCENG